jgi:hypothetical protein
MAGRSKGAAFHLPDEGGLLLKNRGREAEKKEKCGKGW